MFPLVQLILQGVKKDGTAIEAGKDITIEKDISYIEKGGSP